MIPPVSLPQSVPTTPVNMIEVFVDASIGGTNNITPSHLLHLTRSMLHSMHSIFLPAEISMHGALESSSSLTIVTYSSDSVKFDVLEITMLYEFSCTESSAPAVQSLVLQSLLGRFREVQYGNQPLDLIDWWFPIILGFYQFLANKTEREELSR